MDSETPTGQTPLHMAAANGHDAVVQCLLQHGASINHSDNQLGYTALHYAASQARAALVPLLVQHGADGDCSSLSLSLSLSLSVSLSVSLSLSLSLSLCLCRARMSAPSFAAAASPMRCNCSATCWFSIRICGITAECGVLGTQSMPLISSERRLCMKRPTGARMRAL